MTNVKMGLLIAAVGFTAVACVPPEEAGVEDVSAAPVAAEAVETTTQALGSETCKNVDLYIRNNFTDGSRTPTIQIDWIEYRLPSGWNREDLPNDEITTGANHKFDNEDLGHAYNDPLESWNIRFRFRESDGDWSDWDTQSFSYTGSPTCTDSRVYSLVVD